MIRDLGQNDERVVSEVDVNHVQLTDHPITVDMTQHPPGSLNTAPDFRHLQVLPAKPLLQLDDDTPLTGACSLDDPECEACQ